MHEAIVLFKEAVTNKKNGIDFTVSGSYKTRDELYKSIDFYTMGPWLILEILREIEMNWEEDMIANCIEMITKKEAIPLETILKIIKKAININPLQFLNHIEKQFNKGFI
jgi:hypothetical protein